MYAQYRKRNLLNMYRKDDSSESGYGYRRARSYVHHKLAAKSDIVP